MTRLITSKTSTVKKIAASGVKNTSTTIPFNTGSFPESESTYELNYTLGTVNTDASNTYTGGLTFDGVFTLGEVIWENLDLNGWFQGEKIISSEALPTVHYYGGGSNSGPTKSGTSGTFNTDTDTGVNTTTNPSSYQNWYDYVNNVFGNNPTYPAQEVADTYNLVRSPGEELLYYTVTTQDSNTYDSRNLTNNDSLNNTNIYKAFQNVSPQHSSVFWNTNTFLATNRTVYITSVTRYYRWLARIFYVENNYGIFQVQSTGDYGTTVSWDLSNIRINPSGLAYNISTGETESGSFPLSQGAGQQNIKIRAWGRSPVVTGKTITSSGNTGGAYWVRYRQQYSSGGYNIDYISAIDTANPYDSGRNYYSLGMSVFKDQSGTITWLKQPPSSYEYNLIVNATVPAGVTVSNTTANFQHLVNFDFNQDTFYSPMEVSSLYTSIPWQWFRNITVNLDVEGSIKTAAIHRAGDDTAADYKKCLVIGVPQAGSLYDAAGAGSFTFNLDLTAAAAEINNASFAHTGGAEEQDVMFAIEVADKLMLVSDDVFFVSPTNSQGRYSQWTLNITGGLQKLKGRKIKYGRYTRCVTFLDTGKGADEVYIVGYYDTNDSTAVINNLNAALANELTLARVTRTTANQVYLNDTLLVKDVNYTFNNSTKALVITGADIQLGDVIEIIY
jgi:hypothetical protein